MARHAFGKRAVAVLAVASAAALTLSGAPSAHAAPTHLGKLSDYQKIPTGTPVSLTPNRWFVETQGAPTAKGGNGASNQQVHANVKNTAKSNGLSMAVDREYTDLWNGMAVTIPDEQVPLLAAQPGVTKVFPITSVAQPQDRAGKPTDAYSEAMTGANVVRDSLGYTGKGIKVGVIDSGIDLDHPDLGGNGIPGQAPFPNKRVKYGYDFVGDNYDSEGKYGSKTPVPDANPDDCGGHGTHVAGIIGANGNPATGGVEGLAPDVTFGAYRIFGCEGSVDTDVIIAALEMSYKDGMDVVNMSLGWSLATWPGYPEAVAADNLVDRGVIVVDAAGNDGEKGTFTGGAPAVGLKSIAVGSVENTTITSRAFKLNNDRLIAYSVGDNAKAPTSGSMPVASAGPDQKVTAGTEPVGGCDAAGPITADTKGKALLMRRGACTFTEKAANAQKAGATAAIIYNNDDTMLTPAVDPSVTIPVFIIPNSDGLAIQAAIAAGNATVSFSGDWTKVSPNPQGGLMSTFSSYGLAADLTLKPDVSAPGGNIWSTYPLEKGKYTNMSGTSMATPHVVGVVAQLLQAKPEYKGKALAVRDLLQNNATPLLFHLAPQLGLLDSVHDQGAGLVNIVKSLEADNHITPGKLSVGDDALFAKHTQTLTLSNDSAQAITYALTNETAVTTLGSTSDPDFNDSAATVSMPQSVTVPAHGSTQVTVTVTSPATAEPGEIYGGYITFTSGDRVLRVPYAGMKGDYQNLPVLTDAVTGEALPSLAVYDPEAGEVVPLPTDAPKQSFNNTTNPAGLAFHLEYPVSAVQIDVYQVNPGGQKKFVATIDKEGMLGRDDSYLSLLWDGSYNWTNGGGKVKNEVVKSGDYYFVLKVTTATPEPGNPKYKPVYQTWQSPVFHLEVSKNKK